MVDVKFLVALLLPPLLYRVGFTRLLSLRAALDSCRTKSAQTNEPRINPTCLAVRWLPPPQHEITLFVLVTRPPSSSSSS